MQTKNNYHPIWHRKLLKSGERIGHKAVLPFTFQIPNDENLLSQLILTPHPCTELLKLQ